VKKKILQKILLVFRQVKCHTQQSAGTVAFTTSNCCDKLAPQDGDYTTITFLQWASANRQPVQLMKTS